LGWDIDTEETIKEKKRKLIRQRDISNSMKMLPRICKLKTAMIKIGFLWKNNNLMGMENLENQQSKLSLKDN
jgi:hypothetical protein